MSLEIEGVRILKNVNLTIEKGSSYLLVGRNGSGKTSLLRVMAGLISPTSGKIFIDDREVKDVLELRSVTGYIFQNPQTQVIGCTVEEDVAFGLENLGLDREVMKKRVEEVLKEVELLELRCEEPITLSGGQLQRLAIASVIALEPSFLLLDEPLSMLDERSKEDVLSLLKKFHRSKGLVVATHDIEHYDFCDYVIYMDNGEAKLFEIHEFFSVEREEVFRPSWA